MKHSLEDQRMTEHLMEVIARTLRELYELYPSQGPFSAEAALLTAGILILINHTDRSKAARAVRTLAAEIESGGFDGYSALGSMSVQ